MKKLNKITSILIIQAMMLGNCAWAGELSAQSKMQSACLSPEIMINSNQFQGDSFIKKILVEVLKTNKWNVAKASREPIIQKLDISLEQIFKILDRRWIKQQREKEDEKEKKDILEAVDKFIKYKDCRIKAAAYLGMDAEKLDDKLKKYRISIRGIKYAEKRVLPVLKKNKGSRTQSSLELGIDRDTLKKKFGKYTKIIKSEYKERKKIKEITAIDRALKETNGNRKKAAVVLGIGYRTLRDWLIRYNFFKLTKEELIRYRIEDRVINIGDFLFDISEKALIVDKNNQKAVQQFFTLTDFKIFRISKTIEEIDNLIVKIYSPSDLIKKVEICRQVKENIDYILKEGNLDEIALAIDHYKRYMEELIAKTEADTFEKKTKFGVELKKNENVLLSNVQFIGQSI